MGTLNLPHRWLKRFLTVEWMRVKEMHMSTINVANHTSHIYSCVLPKFNHY